MKQTKFPPVSLSQSDLWRLQRSFYEDQGIEAWRQNVVPNYITSNPALASAYARVVLGFLRDYYHQHLANFHQQAQGPEDSRTPQRTKYIYIIELGAGSGRFSYLFLKKFLPLLQNSAFKHLPVKYIMTDVSIKLIDYWQSHPSLQPFIAQGVLDFAFFDAEQPRNIELIISGNSLETQSEGEPLIVLANYFFDSIPQDIFEVNAGQLYEKLVSFDTGNEGGLESSAFQEIDNIKLTYASRPVNRDFYPDLAWNKILNNYCQTLDRTNLLFPKLALHCIEYFQQLFNSQMLLLSADKGFTEAKDLLAQPEPEIVFHGSISLMVNYHAIGQYILNQGGQYLWPGRTQKFLNICAFLSAPESTSVQLVWPETTMAYREVIENYNPIDFYILKKGLEQVYEHLSLEQLLACLRLSGWDSNIFMGCLSDLLKQISQASAGLKEEMIEAAAKVWDNYYPLGEAKDIAFSLGLLLFGLEQYKKALEYFEQSLQIYGSDAGTIYNIGMCYRNIGQPKKGQTYITKAKVLDPTLVLN